MEFKKIDETKFQCLLYEEDLEDNNISIDDFFRNDTAKIHGLLDVVMEEAQKSIGIIMDSGVMSLQLAPQPNHSILLTISSGKDDFGDMLRQAGERASQAISALKPQKDKGSSNVIKNKAKENKEDATKIAPFNSLAKENSNDQSKNSSVTDKNDENVAMDLNMVDSDFALFELSSLNDFEEFCMYCAKTYGIHNSLYKKRTGKEVLFVVERGRCSMMKFQAFVNQFLEYGELISTDQVRKSSVSEHCETLISSNAVNIMKKILN